MLPSQWPDYLNGTLAKSKRDDQQHAETLAEHTWNVLERLSELATLRPDLADLLNAPNVWHCLFWACFLHDFGKAAQGFQNMLKSGERWKRRHEVLSLAFLDWIVPELSETEQKWILAAIVSHHRDASEIENDYRERLDPHPVVGMVAELEESVVRDLWKWLHECGTAWIDALNLGAFGVSPLLIVDEERAVKMTCIEGVKRTHRWLAEYRMLIRDMGDEDQHIITTLIMLRGLTTTADHMASAHLERVPQGIQDSWENLASRSLRGPMFYHQHESAVHHSNSAMLIAPTGSGKTEAALFWAMGDGKKAVPRIFYALPYQASMNAMHKRLRSPNYFQEEQVGLQHGRALQALYRRLLQDSECGPKTAKQDAEWRRNLTRLHAYPIKVFSPYQMLKAVYEIKGFEGMLADYTQAKFIFDEIHAYDPDRLAIILCLVKHLRERFGTQFFIMSATFPKVLQDILSTILGVQEPIVAEPELFRDFRRHHLRLLNDDLLINGIDRIADDMQQGKSVLICCNTVRRAQEMWAALCAKFSSEQVKLIHSRFTFRDRIKHEEAIHELCEVGATHEGASTGLAVVATQVVEVSLNIDLDTIYSDPAPLDALVQRFGRINRARKKGIVPVHVFREPRDGQYVYKASIVQRTLDVLEAHNEEDIDEAEISKWLNEIYEDPKVYKPWMDAYNKQYDLVDWLLKDLRPFNSDKAQAKKFEELFDGVEVLPECFEQEYAALIEKDAFIEASSLFVSISQRKYMQFANKGKMRWLPDDKYQRGVILQQYDPEQGLLFDTASNDQPDND